MASEKILKEKQLVISEIKDKISNSDAVVFFDYRGLTVTEVTDLRRKLRETDSEFKVYKNTLTKRALDELKISLDDFMNGPNAIVFSNDVVSPIKTLANFAKTHKALEMRVGIIDGEISGIDILNQLATIPSREGLLTMLAAGMMGTVKDLSICLDLYTKDKE